MTTSETCEDLVRTLADQVTEGLLGLLTPGEPVALLDYPNHNNVGDNAIWLGERKLLECAGIPVAYTCDLATYDPRLLRRRVGSGPILLHGGGNFGDLWPAHQHFREQVLRDFPSQQVLQLPQSVFFQNPKELERARRIFGRHPRFTLLARDSESTALGRQHLGVECHQLPDSAFGLGLLACEQPPCVPVLWLARSDHEARYASVDGSAVDGLEIADWLSPHPTSLRRTIRNSLQVRTRRLTSGFARIPSVGFLARLTAPRAFDVLAAARLARGLRILSRGEVVITDRLHGHILSLLLGTRHVVLDTRHGKISRFIDAYTRPCSLFTMAGGPDEALAHARALLSGEQ